MVLDAQRLPRGSAAFDVDTAVTCGPDAGDPNAQSTVSEDPAMTVAAMAPATMTNLALRTVLLQRALPRAASCTGARLLGMRSVGPPA